jgi:toxin ParE1/3/4
VTPKPVVFSPRARADLRSIIAFLRREAGLRTARRWKEKLEAKARLIGESPLAFAEDPELGPGRRRLVVEPYLIVYEPQPSRVLILGVVHGARDLPALFADEV